MKQIFANKNIDTKNVEYDFDISKEFTWEFRDLVEIKKRRRYVTKIYPANAKNLLQVRSAKKFEKSRKEGKLVTNAKAFKDYRLFEFHPTNEYNEAEEAAKQKERYEIYLNNGGRKFRPKKRVATS